MTQESASGNAVAERLRASSLAVGDSSPVEAMLANSLREGKPLADDGALHESVQTAENAASSFVFVPPGTFQENVSITTTGMTLLGAGPTTLIDGGSSGTAISIEAQNVTVESLAFQTDTGSSQYGVRTSGAPTADGAVIKNCIGHDAGGDTIETRSTRCKVINCEIYGSDQRGIALNGEKNIARGCYSTACSNNLIHGRTNHCNIVNCIVDGSNSGSDAIRVDSGDCLVGGNRVRNSARFGIYVGTGGNHIIYNNRVSDSSSTEIRDDGTSTTLDSNLTGASN